jgi:hypothetical protein
LTTFPGSEKQSVPKLDRKNFMKRKLSSQSALFNPRILLTLVFCAGGVLLALLALYPGTSARAQGSQQNPAASRRSSLTAQEAQTLADGLKALVNDSSEGLAPQTRADGSVSVNLEGRFQNVVVAKMEDDGSVSQSCVNNPEAAAAFFGLNLQSPGASNAAPVAQDPAKPLVDR